MADRPDIGVGNERGKTRIVLDVDTGIDDTLAIAYLLGSPNVDLLGVIGVYGNVTAETAVRNTRDVLRLFGRPDVPVLHGMPRPSWADCFEVDEGCARFHGTNGLGNVNPAEYVDGVGGDAGVDVGAGGAGTAGAGVIGAGEDVAGADVAGAGAGVVVLGGDAVGGAGFDEGAGVDGGATGVDLAGDVAELGVDVDLNRGADTDDVVGGAHGTNLADVVAEVRDSLSVDTDVADADSAVADTGFAAEVHTFAASGRVKSVGGYRADAEADLEEVVAAEQAVRRAESEGVKFIVDAVRRYGRDVIVLATGPLTDVAAAIDAAPDIVDHLRVVMMGGALTQEGNCYDLVCETNIIQDPEAANRVFRSGADVTMVGLDVTHQCLLTRADAQSWRDTGTARGRFLADMVEFYINANEDADPMFLAGSPLHDPLAAAVALDPTLVSCFDVNMMVETRTGDGYGFRGRTIGDPTRLRTPRKTAHVALGVDADRFVSQFRDRVASLCR
ncbi:nucleoside hydrolase [Bifidobacterium tissieri]|uniref:Nucleoside hydrolase n=1 Tax=Bifidobacterium tissieri TaxID=1630162 RepID=A0A261FIG4_9BIFI|nr:nucleoside hydrolase [Bifidobacterium tissieri]OZG58656.1 nucleoside hydrolase [Bifidobacterium tissieri]